MPSATGNPPRAHRVPRGKGRVLTLTHRAQPELDPRSLTSPPIPPLFSLLQLLCPGLLALPQTRLACYYLTALLKLFPLHPWNVPPPDIWLPLPPSSSLWSHVTFSRRLVLTSLLNSAFCPPTPPPRTPYSLTLLCVFFFQQHSSLLSYCIRNLYIMFIIIASFLTAIM